MANNNEKYNGVSENKFLKINKTYKSFKCSNGSFINTMAISDSYKNAQGVWVYTNQYTVKWFSERQYNLGEQITVGKITKAVVESFKDSKGNTCSSFVIYIEAIDNSYQGYQGQQPYQAPPQPQYQGYQGEQGYQAPPQPQYQGYQQPQYQAPCYQQSNDDVDY